MHVVGVVGGGLRYDVEGLFGEGRLVCDFLYDVCQCISWRVASAVAVWSERAGERVVQVRVDVCFACAG